MHTDNRNHPHFGFSVFAIILLLGAMYATFILMHRADDLSEENFRNAAKVPFLMLWPAAWLSAQKANCVSFRTILIEGILLMIPFAAFYFLVFAA